MTEFTHPTGVVIADLVDQLDVFPDPRTWSFRLRRPLLALPKPDVALIARELRRVARPVEERLGDYLPREQCRDGAVEPRRT
jgi:hypothetical protein